jgi:acetyl esterase
MRPSGLLALGVRLLLALPVRLRRLIAGPAVRVDSQELDLDVQVLLRLMERAQGGRPPTHEPLQRRAEMSAGVRLTSGRPISRVHVRDLTIPVDGDMIGARLYAPAASAVVSPLLVFYHGGGFALGDLDTHDNVCRFFARHAGVRVLSVAYRLAPEHRFPVAVEDCLAAFRFAHAHAGEWGADAASIAVGGDSAGGNLAAVVAQMTTRSGGPAPVFQLLLYPTTHATARTPSRDLFGSGFILTREDLQWFFGQYAGREEDMENPRFSPLLAEDLSGLPPAYVATAGFDPLRDEGEAYADRLRQAGVAVTLSRQPGLVHGYASMAGLGGSSRAAVDEAAAALRVGCRATRDHG